MDLGSVKGAINWKLLIGLLVGVILTVALRETMYQKSPSSKFIYHDLAEQLADGQHARGEQERIAALVWTGSLLDNRQPLEVEGTLAELNLLASHPSVRTLAAEFDLQPDLKQGLALIGADQVREKYDGSGVSIAVIDSGIDPTHPMLGGSADCNLDSFPNDKVIGGWDTGELDPLPCDSATHGTSVAGIAAGLIPDSPAGPGGDYVGGVAPGAKLYALKITKANGRPGSNAYLKALQWIAYHWNKDPDNPILVVNNSNTWNAPVSERCGANPTSYERKVLKVLDRLDKLGITVFNSAGNKGAVNAVQWPGCFDRVHAVGAVRDTTDEVLPSSNSGALVDFLAPANPVISLGANGGYAKFGTTSAATPYAAGSAAVLQQAARSTLGRFLRPAEVVSLLTTTGVMRVDPKADPPISRPRIDLAAAINKLSTMSP